MNIEYVERPKDIKLFGELKCGDIFLSSGEKLYMKIKDTCICIGNQYPETCNICSSLTDKNFDIKNAISLANGDIWSFSLGDEVEKVEGKVVVER